MTALRIELETHTIPHPSFDFIFNQYRSFVSEKDLIFANAVEMDVSHVYLIGIESRIWG
jgi:hypothetical protein